MWSFEFGVLGWGFRVWGVGCGVPSFVFRVWGFGADLSALMCRAFQVLLVHHDPVVLCVRVSCFGLWGLGLEFRVLGFTGFGFQDSGFGFRVAGFGFQFLGFG